MYVFRERTTLKRWNVDRVAFMTCVFSDLIAKDYQNFCKGIKKPTCQHFSNTVQQRNYGKLSRRTQRRIYRLCRIVCPNVIPVSMKLTSSPLSDICFHKIRSNCWTDIANMSKRLLEINHSISL
ncbi:unnamed protein product [Brassica rapa subsp. narinosa]